MSIKLSQILIYPVKSIAGLSVNDTSVEPYGLLNDRCLMLVDENGLFISQRKYPQLALISIINKSNVITFSAPYQSPISITQESISSQSKKVDVWGDQCNSFVAHKVVNQWFSEFLKQPTYLVRYDHSNPRYSDPAFSKPNDIVSFADGFPILLLSQASLDDLNSKLDKKVSINNFRPNLVIKGCDAFQEDNWKTIKIGQQTFDLVKQCSRCILTTVDPVTGQKDSNGQPLRELSTYRRNQAGVVFGMNLIPRNSGKISINDEVIIVN